MALSTVEKAAKHPAQFEDVFGLLCSGSAHSVTAWAHFVTGTSLTSMAADTSVNLWMQARTAGLVVLCTCS